MSASCFSSALAGRIDAFVAWKRAQGYHYGAVCRKLARFDRFVLAQGYDKDYLSAELMRAYHDSFIGTAPHSKNSPLSAVRTLARYLQPRVPQSEAFPLPPGRCPQPVRVYLYSQADIRALLAACDNLRGHWRQRVYQQLICLLVVTGMRIDELLSLTWADLDLGAGILHIRDGKFAKDRDLLLADSSVKALRAYRADLRQAGGGQSRSHVIVDPRDFVRGKAPLYDTVYVTFCKLLAMSRVGVDAPKRPRLHDFRHTFATATLSRWYREDRDVQALLPVLATHLGHVHISESQIYLHHGPELLGYAKDRFQHHNRLSLKDQDK